MLTACFAIDGTKVWVEKNDSRMVNAYNRLYSFVNVCKRIAIIIKMAKSEQKTCLECGNTIVGRIDKKFCSDLCRIAYNNKLNSDDTNYVRNVNNILRKNRRILLDLNPEGKNKVSRDKLKAKGFDFRYFTSTYTTKEGSLYFYCYDQGYLPIEKESYLLVIKKDF